jgi:hypothetical protein
MLTTVVAVLRVAIREEGVVDPAGVAVCSVCSH